MSLRRQLLDRLLAVLAPQICSGVELLVFEFSPELPVGENRERLRREARGEYISFVDDDDLVPPDFVQTILPALDGVDYVGFNLEQRINGSFRCIEKRSLRYHGVSQDDSSGMHYRDIAHTNPVRRDLALQVPMSGFPEEDTRWADAIRKLGIIKTEHYIDKTLYYYLFRTDKPEEQNRPAIPTMKEFPWLMQRTKVKMCVSIAGNADPNYDQPEFGYAPGQVVEVHPELAKAWVASGSALLIEEEAAPVTEPEPEPEPEPAEEEEEEEPAEEGVTTRRKNSKKKSR